MAGQGSAQREPGARAASRWRAAAGPLALVLLVAGLYAPALRNGFVYDDRILIVEQPRPRGAAELLGVFAERHWFNLPYYRPVARFTMVLQKALHGNDPAPFHAANVAFGAAAALLLLALLRERAFAIARPAAWLAAALFAAHPIAADCIHPISSGRETLLPAAFSLAALLAWLRAGAAWRVAALACLALALLAKEQAIVVPVLFAWADRTGVAPGPRGRGVAAWVRRYAPVAAIVAAWAAVRALVLGGAGGLRVAVLDAPLGPLWSVLYTLQTIFAPFGELVYEPRLEVWLSAPRLALALAGACALGLAAARASAPRRRAALFFAGLAALSILPTANLLVQEARFAERYGLLALAGVAGVAAAAASGLWERPRTRWPATAAGLALVAAAGLASRGLAAAFADDLAFHTQWLRTDPQAAQPHVGLGQWWAERGRSGESLAHYEAALALRPDYAVAHAALGAVLLGQGRAGDALPHLERALALDPRDAGTLSNLGVALMAEGRLADAKAAFERALALDPGSVSARRNLAVLRARSGGRGSRAR